MTFYSVYMLYFADVRVTVESGNFLHDKMKCEWELIEVVGSEEDIPLFFRDVLYVPAVCNPAEKSLFLSTAYWNLGLEH